MQRRRALRIWLALLAALAFSVAPVRAEAPVIRDARGALRANVVPATEWCAPVVSVDLYATQQIFEKQSEAVQRFIGAVRASVEYDCPTVEIIRIRGFAGKAGVFFAYTAKASDWSIRVYSSVNSVLPMLAVKKTSGAALRELADFETRTQFSRARIEDVAFENVEPGNEIDHVAWQIGGIRGATYVVTDRRVRYRSLGDFTDVAAHVLVDRCVNDSGGSPQNAVSGNALPNMQSRTFECARDQTQTYVAIAVTEVDSVTTIFVMNSEYRSSLNALLKFITDKSILY